MAVPATTATAPAATRAFTASYVWRNSHEMKTTNNGLDCASGDTKINGAFARARYVKVTPMLALEPAKNKSPHVRGDQLRISALASLPFRSGE